MYLQSVTKLLRHCARIGWLQRTKESAPLPCPLHSKLGCLLFLEQRHSIAELYFPLLKCEVSQLMIILSPSDCRLNNFNMNIIFTRNINLSPPQRLPMGIPIKNIAIIKYNSEYYGQSYMHFLFAHFQDFRLQHNKAWLQRRETVCQVP